MTTEVRAALIGYGLGGRIFHAPFLRAVDGFTLTAIVTSDAKRSAQAIGETGVPVLPSVDDLWTQADALDLVVISTGNAAHVPLAEAALDHGLNVVVDKPLCADASTAQHLAQRAAAADRLLVTFQNRRFDGDFLTLRQLIADGELGMMHRLESRFERWRPEPKGGWRESADPADLGGLLYDLGSHVIDQALVVLGSAESVYAEVSARRAGALVDDDTFVAVTHAGGAVSHHWVSALAAAPGPRYRAMGSRGAYIINDLDPQEDTLRDDLSSLPPSTSNAPWGLRSPEDDGTLFTSAGARVIPTVPGDYRLFWSGVHAALTEGAPSPVPIEQTVELMAVLDAARASALTGTVQPVVLPS